MSEPKTGAGSGALKAGPAERAAPREERERVRSGAVTMFETALCLFVIFVHVAGVFLADGDTHGRFTRLIFVCRKLLSFSMTGFIFMSALKQTVKYESEPLRYGSFLLSRLRRVYAPYVVWVVIYYAYYAWSAHFFTFDAAKLLVYIVNGTLAAHFYFVVIIMQFYLLAPPLSSFARRVKPPLGLTAAVLVTVAAVYLGRRFSPALAPISADYLSPSYIAYWMLGVYCGQNYAAFERFTKKRAAPLIAVYCVIAAVHITMSYRQFTGVSAYRAGEYAQILYRLSAIPALFALFGAIEPRIGGTARRVIKSLHALTYPVYLSHILVIQLAERVINENYPDTPPSVRFVFIAAAAFTVPFAASRRKISRKNK
ncbi:MAG: acyltransferase [Oscillospiraceae bacterium]|jgi:peptidoglycan/LPS O-acetylase OafA/YrhL|nr:acyltransferase [Oscillospiraceae bacterium]